MYLFSLERDHSEVWSAALGLDHDQRALIGADHDRLPTQGADVLVDSLENHGPNFALPRTTRLGRVPGDDHPHGIWGHFCSYLAAVLANGQAQR